jgi:hypothetical protein
MILSKVIVKLKFTDLYIRRLPFFNTMSQNNNNKNDKRGLASSADEETKERVARAGGEAPHDERGLQAADEETRKRVAREGGKA